MLREIACLATLILALSSSSASATNEHEYSNSKDADNALIEGNLTNRTATDADQVLILIEGSCSSVNETDIVLEQTVNKWGFPFFIREKQISWHGDKNITCLTVFGTENPDHPGSVTITDGGIGHFYITLDLKSEWGWGLHMIVYVYAKSL